MVQKRSFDDEGTLEISSKHPKQMEHCDQLVSFSESVLPREASQKSYGVDDRQGWSEGGGKLEPFHELPRTDGSSTQTAATGSLSVSWATSSTSEEDTASELPIYLPVFPEYFSSMSPMRTFVRCEDIYSVLLESLPRKSVAVGPDHQADVLHWDVQQRKRSSSDPDKAHDDSRSRVEDEDQLRFMGTCVVPMPNMGSSTYDEELGKGRTDCSCEDSGSVRCARQHILEEREKLVDTIGQEWFIDLGLNEIGVLVAKKWSAEEEQLFHQVVFSNPASLGTNFWNNLSSVFPSRTKKEIVSYYFNVFMLRRRAEQNRNEAMSIDSDNDEWLGHDDFGDNGLGMDEDDEDSIVESSVSQDAHGRLKNDWVEYDEHTGEETYNDSYPNVESVLHDDYAKSGSMRLIDECATSPVNHLHDGTIWDERCAEDVQDGSCTSSDTGPAVRATNVEGGKNVPQKSNCNRVGFGSHEYVLEPCDIKVWNPGFSSCSKDKVEFLPTCSMIEEVFGDETCEFQGKR